VLRRLIQSAIEHRTRRLNGRGIALWQQGDLARAERTLLAVLRRDPRHAGAASNLGMVLAAQGRMDESVDMLRLAVDVDPAHAGARVNLAALLHQGGGIPEAVLHLREALAIEPDNTTARANLWKPLMDLCDWQAVAAEVDRLKAEAQDADRAESWADAIAPFESLLLPFSPEFQLRVARHHAARYAAMADTASGRPRIDAAPRRHGRSAPLRDAAKKPLRIGYLSADFHDHATAHLSAGLYAAHDRTRFEVCAYSIGHHAALTHSDGAAYRRRIEEGCDRFVDLSSLPAQAAAQRIAADGVDILIDMKGYTGGSRPEILARRAAPVQVSFLGYPGTMGADFIDYLVADRVVVPPGAERWYSERLAYMPASYQINDDTQAIGGKAGELAAETPSRAALGLPEHGVVFCCFNHVYKTEPVIFGAWMRILSAVPGSVLWLQSGHPVAEGRLRAAADAAAVDPARLVFAGYAPKSAHLARLVQADLFLDTHVVNAHTTASDALWAGVPLLTFPGESFASRVAASLLSAIGLPECAAKSISEYERLAIELARDPGRCLALRERLRVNRATMPLFDTQGYVRALEAQYQSMWAARSARVAG
jgi:predicted O-linked N-acetylglucosamine transferase (SPINDLY family)